MRKPQTTALNHITGSAIELAADRLAAFVRALEIKVCPGSWLDERMRAAREFAEVDIVAHSDLDGVRSRRAGMADVHFLAEMLGRIEKPTRADFARHVALLGKADHSAVQPARRRSRKRDRFLEVLVAAAVAPWADEVELGEPDVLARRGERSWGVACKNAGATGDQLVKNIKRGCDQVKRSTAQRGLVVVRVSDLAGAVQSGADVPARFVGPGPTFSSHDAAADGVYQQLDDVVRPESVVESAFKIRSPSASNVAAIVFLGHVLCDVLRPDGVRITILQYFRCLPDESVLDAEAASLVDALRRGFQPW